MEDPEKEQHSFFDGWVGALDGLSPGLSAASSSESLKGLMRGRRTAGRAGVERETDSDWSSKVSRDSSSENLRDVNDFRAEPRGPLSAAQSSLGLSERAWRAASRTSTQQTRVQFQVSVETELGDQVRVVGSCPQLGCWQPDKSQPLTTDPTMYPMWTGSVEMSSSEPFEYKYLIERQARVHEGFSHTSQPSNAEREFTWETSISNRSATPEGVFIVLEDGKFNVERATVFDRSHRKVNLSHASRYNGFLEQAVTVTGECLYIISFKLPVKTTRGPSGEYMFDWHPGSHSTTSSRHAGYVVEKLRKLRKRAEIWYIGWLGIEIPERDQELVRNLLRAQMRCLPVFIDNARAAEFEKICNSIIRPMFHLSVPVNTDMCDAFHKPPHQWQSMWQMYNKVNLEMVTVLVEAFNDNDYVWVIDTELLMVPAFVGTRCKTANVAFVFNTPFPSSDIFRMLPARKDILRSLLNSDMIMFHCFTYARHFLTCCSRLLGLEYHAMRGGLLQLLFRGRHVHIRASHVGMDSKTFLYQLSRDTSVEAHTRQWRQAFGHKQVILGYDDLEPMSGLLLLVHALESLVRLFPNTLGNVVLVLVAVPLLDAQKQEMHLDYKRRVEQQVEKLNDWYPGLVVMHQRRMAFAERVSLFASADMLVNAAVRHGLNLVPFEFVLCGADKHPGFVVSEFLGCSRVMPGALRTNPWRDEDMAKAIYKLLNQEAHEKAFWHHLQVDFCKNNTVVSWADKAFLDMKRIRELMTSLGEDVRSRCRVGIAKMPHKEMSENYLKVEQVYEAYQQTTTRLLIVDIDLLLRPILHPEKALEGRALLASKHSILRCLRNLSQQSGNFIFLLSSNTPEEIKQFFGDSMESLSQVGLAAEDGYWYKWPGSPPDRWDARVHLTDGWKQVALGLMTQYTQRTNGSYIEDDKKSSITWHWTTSKDRSNDEFGALQGKELHNHLQEMLAHFAVRIKMGRTYVRVRHEGVTKGSFVEHVIKHYNNRGGVDMLFIIADDVADEDIFKVAAAYHRDVLYRLVSTSTTLQQVKVFTCTVGRQPSSASYCLFNAEEVLELMGGLYLLNKRIKRRKGLASLDSASSSPAGSRSPSSRSRTSPRGSPGGTRSSGCGPHAGRPSSLSGRAMPAPGGAAAHSTSLSPARRRDPSPFPVSPLLPALPSSLAVPPNLADHDADARAAGRDGDAPSLVRERREDSCPQTMVFARHLGEEVGGGQDAADDEGDSQPVTQMVREKVRGRNRVRARAAGAGESSARQHLAAATGDKPRGRREGGAVAAGEGSMREWEVLQQAQRARDVSLSPDWKHPWRDWSPGEGRVR